MNFDEFIRHQFLHSNFNLSWFIFQLSFKIGILFRLNLWLNVCLNSWWTFHFPSEDIQMTLVERLTFYFWSFGASLSSLNNCCWFFPVPAFPALPAIVATLRRFLEISGSLNQSNRMALTHSHQKVWFYDGQYHNLNYRWILSPP